MFANPSITTRLVTGVRVGAGGTLVGIVKVVGRHDPLEGVVVGQVEAGGQLVEVVLLVGEDTSGATMTALIVVVVDKGQSVESVGKSLRKMARFNTDLVTTLIKIYLSISVKTAESVIPNASQPISGIELGHLSDAKVLIHVDDLSPLIDDLMEDKRSISVHVVPHALHGLEVAGPHVLGGVHAEALDAEADQVVDVVGNLASHVVLAAVQVVETHEVAVANLFHVLVVVDFTVGLVKVQT